MESWIGASAIAVFKQVALARRWTQRFTGTLQRQTESFAVPTHPTRLSRRYSRHQGIRPDIAIDHCACRNECILAYRNAADDGGVRPESCTLAHKGSAIFVLAGHGSARIIDIGEDHARPAEHIVFQRYGVIDADVVLYFDVVADEHVVADEDILAEGTACADPRPAADVHPVPDAGSVAD